ncbi:MAG: hypothetical protein JWP97_3631 [Labilithrix sp.]|nr:hypothetical protein [Labilithrix sp.]
MVPASGFASACEPNDWCGGGTGAGADAKFGGATPTMVPFRRLRASGPGAAPAGGAPAPIGGASAVKPGPDAGPDAGGPA